MDSFHATDLYPPIAPYASGVLAVDAGHRLYWEQCGSPGAIPVVYLHGGPGSGCLPAHRRFYDPDRYRIVLFDQRGCGRSTPIGSTDANTTQDLIARITSYNVCYTKLLRVDEGEELLPERLVEAHADRNNFV